MVWMKKQLCFCRKHGSSHLGLHWQTQALIFPWKKERPGIIPGVLISKSSSIWETWKSLGKASRQLWQSYKVFLHFTPLFWVLNAARGASWGEPKIIWFSCVSSSRNPWNQLFQEPPGPLRHQDQALFQFPGNNNPSQSRKFSIFLLSRPRFVFQSGIPGLPEHPAMAPFFLKQILFKTKPSCEPGISTFASISSHTNCGKSKPRDS